MTSSIAVLPRGKTVMLACICLVYFLMPAFSAQAQEPAKSETTENIVERVWNYQVTTTEVKTTSGGKTVTTRQGITIGKIVLATIGLIAGLLLAGAMARGFGRTIDKRFRVDAGRRDILQKMLFFLLIVFVVLTTLNWLDIPLTTFAFLGGALAIGVGFGTQTLMNNFISGLIMLFEQQIKVGDVIEVDGSRGRVVNLGGRCTQVLLADGSELLVPNSYLLEKSVTNLTLGDTYLRFDFVVGVGYGSPTNEVMAIMEKALADEPAVVKERPREVFFEAFGDSTLNFHIYYWLNIRESDNRLVGSNLRLHIEKLCRDAKIDIAYPQRDIHLHTDRPISVRMERENS